MPSYQEKITRHTIREKPQFEEKEQVSEQDMAGSSDWEFKTTMTDILRALKDKVGSIQEQMAKVSRELEILRKNKTKF